MMKLFFSAILMLSSILLTAQTDFNLKSLLPEDSKVSKGVLDNGMTYSYNFV